MPLFWALSFTSLCPWGLPLFGPGVDQHLRQSGGVLDLGSDGNQPCEAPPPCPPPCSPSHIGRVFVLASLNSSWRNACNAIQVFLGRFLMFASLYLWPTLAMPTEMRFTLEVFSPSGLLPRASHFLLLLSFSRRSWWRGFLILFLALHLSAGCGTLDDLIRLRGVREEDSSSMLDSSKTPFFLCVGLEGRR